jgi:hypothetical protein
MLVPIEVMENQALVKEALRYLNRWIKDYLHPIQKLHTSIANQRALITEAREIVDTMREYQLLPPHLQAPTLTKAEHLYHKEQVAMHLLRLQWHELTALIQKEIKNKYGRQLNQNVWMVDLLDGLLDMMSMDEDEVLLNGVKESWLEYHALLTALSSS